jgi:hypothetical protein
MESLRSSSEKSLNTSVRNSTELGVATLPNNLQGKSPKGERHSKDGVKKKKRRQKSIGIDRYLVPGAKGGEKDDETIMEMSEEENSEWSGKDGVTRIMPK